MCFAPKIPKVELPPPPPPPAPLPQEAISKVSFAPKGKAPKLRGSPNASLTITPPMVVPTKPTNVGMD